MNVFSGCKVYGEKWQIKSSRSFNDEELSMVSKATVVDSQYGKSACFFMCNGTCMYIPMTNDSTNKVGESLDLNACEIVTLGKTGEADITRIKG